MNLKKYKKTGRGIRKYWQIYILLIPVVVWFITFCYYPMYGVIIAFKDYYPKLGIFGSPWAGNGGWQHFIWLFHTTGFTRALKNTIIISALKLLICFPFPIMLSLFLNEIVNAKLKKSIQTAIYLPYFISWVVISGIVYNILAVNGGILNNIRLMMGLDRVSYITQSENFYVILLLSEIWKNAGWGTVIYIAGMSGIDPTLYEAAEIDGAGRFKRMRHITVPCISPIIITMFLLQVGNILNAGFDSIFNLYNASVYDVADILDTYAYRIGIAQGEVEKASALGLFKAIINFALLISSNFIVKRVTGQGLYD
ncbi:MAG: sugar ABC transporter permease [Clostridia bacterium]|nr:sugar ABC transporter permease [Clostridia bacterium]